ncbi:hypothetical protein PVK06_034812 [Gossypium arboreum]|uniref:RNase H type-1 domain-containing protein n=1 Tax=Gossypium arboreum TaxID=29729 RepID=A0ABR0NFQ4_GOSAR|nr:hypothetical protein PVK06_034812 [Gossypium arboreum]
MSPRDLFTRLWKARVPPKIHITAWWFLKNYVPTLYNLYNKHISNTQFFPKCITVPETTTQIVQDCLFATSAWDCLLISWPMIYNDSEFVSWLGFLCKVDSDGGTKLILTTIWAFWLARNRQYHEDLSYTPPKLVSFIRSYLSGRSVLDAHVADSVGSRTVRWQPAGAPLVKANFDAAYSWLFLLGCGYFARDLGLFPVVFEGDSLHVVRKLCNPNEDRSEIRALINEGKQRLLTSFATVEIRHCYREQNSIAHQLASLGVSLAFGSTLGRGGTVLDGTRSCCRD